MDLNNKNILLIEDDKHIFELIKAMLKIYDINLIHKIDGISGLKEALANDFDLILLDIMLPLKDGWEVCRELMRKDVNTPIIMLTAKAEEADKVLGLELGADDYVTKPFSPRELTARIKAVLRRFDKTSPSHRGKEELKIPELDLKIDLKGYNIYIKNNKVNLAPKEFELLTFIARNSNQAFSRKELLQKLWSHDNHRDTRTIDEHIKRLRKKLKKADIKYQPIKTVWGVGYKFEIME